MNKKKPKNLGPGRGHKMFASVIAVVLCLSLVLSLVAGLMTY